jgi:malate dehydrogenase
LHIAQIGTGRVGRPTAYTIMCSEIADTLTLCDVKPGLASAFAEELKHVTASLNIEVEIDSCEQDEEVAGADIILISAGEPRMPGVKMSRRDLAGKNAKIVKYISETTAPRNPGAKYIVVSNPVDAMAMVCKKYSKADFVISTGTNLESLRFRSKLSKMLKVPMSKIQGWVGGEHGDSAISLWSTVKIGNQQIDDFVASRKQQIDKKEVDSYMKQVSKFIVDNIGGTEYGPAASFRDIVRAVTNNTNEILSVASPMMFPEITEPVFVGLPLHLGWNVGVSLFNSLSEEERVGIGEAAKAINQTYSAAIESLEDEKKW